MDHSTSLLLPSAPRFPSKGHARSASRSPTRPRLIDDMLLDLSPISTLETFTSASGTLKASIEAATPTQRAFGIRAAIASKKIHEWVAELSAWPWPTKGSEGFEIPIAKRRKLSNEHDDDHPNRAEQEPRQNDRPAEMEEFWGSLPAQDVLRYESRIEEISEDMEDLNVEEIKSQILDTHVLPRSRPSSLIGHYVEVSSHSYTRMDDLTAVVTATMLQALPSLSRLMALMDMWSVRLAILRQVSSIMSSMEDAEIALKSGWMAIRTQTTGLGPDDSPSNTAVLSRQDYEIIRDVLQQKVSVLGQQLDHMLDALEGRDDTLPEGWLDRMESIEQDYGEWVVCGERKVREGEWATEISKRQQGALRTSLPAMIDPLSETQMDDSVREHQDDTTADETLLTNPHPAHTAVTEAATVRHTQPAEPADVPLPTIESLPRYSGLSLDGTKNSSPHTEVLNDGMPLEDELPNPKRTEEVTERGEPEEKVEQLLGLVPLPSDLQATVINKLPSRNEVVTDLSSLSDGVSDDIVSRQEQTQLSDPPQIFVGIRNETPSTDKDGSQGGKAKVAKATAPATSQHIMTTTASPQCMESAPSLGRPITPPTYGNSGEIMPQPDPSANDYPHDSLSTPSSSEVPGFGHSLANSLPQEMSSEVSHSPSSRSSESSRSNNIFGAATTATAVNTNATERPLTPEKQFIRHTGAQSQAPDGTATLPSSSSPVKEQANPVETSASKSKPPRIDLHLLVPTQISETKAPEHASLESHSSKSSKSHNRGPSSVSMISGYATSEPSPVIYEAEPTEYFRPVSPPVIYSADSPDMPVVATPTRVSVNKPHWTPQPRETPTESTRETDVATPESMTERQRVSVDSPGKEYSIPKLVGLTPSETQSHEWTASDDSAGSVLRVDVNQVGSPREGSVSPDISSTISERLYSVNATPVRISSSENGNTPYSLSTGRNSSIFLKDYEEESPSIGRVRLQDGADDRSPASSPPLESPISEHCQLPLHRSPSFDPDFLYTDSPSTPREPPSLSNIEVSPVPPLASPSKHSDDQLQQQISEILESIPARIRLTSEPDKTGTSGIKQIKKRISLNPFSRPMSRAPTPSFTLAPAHAKNPRPRPQNGNPEIKLYHLSRSTGEAPIKLFVRLVGENGERVMVRVGGGWADLGEYLKEYASHHGRRSDQAGKVEIQDLPSRVVSTGSTASMSTVRNGNGRTSEQSSPISRPSSRPGSALGRPLSSLAIRKTRKSVGEEAREKAYRSPSTPLPHALRSSPAVPRQSETPPSASARSVSSMSWREEESSLGLAGPRSRKAEISAENAAWVESMKEKVRIASAEKEKKEKASFGELGQAGGTKRLFKKSR